ncbi:ABC transporter substrate-binding protein [Mesobacillus maritimus]|uniref:ABC transporter substrate-binding protein n=1 Tax=Mesobacillus maritimus TaxID=1643336 RepID=UPI00203CC4EF|nr:ABC transporter substrate-binding protein [Mesobacillus maritimus]
MLKTKLLLLFASLGLLLSACSISAGNKEGEGTTVQLPSSKELPSSRKVEKFTLSVPPREQDLVQYEMGFTMAEEWKKLGLDVTVEPFEAGTLSEISERKKNLDAFLYQWEGLASRFDPDFFIYDTLHSSNIESSKTNLSGYSQSEYDSIALQQRSVTDPKERKEVIHKAEEMFLKEVPYAPIVHREMLMPYNDEKFTNFTLMPGEGLNSFWTFMNVEPTGVQKYVRWAALADIKSFNPFSTNTTDQQVTRLIYDTLVRVDKNGRPQNWAAESIQLENNDKKNYKVKLRDDLTFHDGEKVTVEDIKFSFDLLQKVQPPKLKELVKPIEKIEIVDEKTIQFVLKEEFAPFISKTLTEVYILPRRHWKPILDKDGEQGILEYKNENPVGSGPFQLNYWESNEEMKLDMNTGHFSPAKVNGILRIPYKTKEDLLVAVKNGQAEIGGIRLSALEWKEAEGNLRGKVLSVSDIGFDSVIFNTQKQPLDDQTFRQALAFAIPKKQIVEELLAGKGDSAIGLISPNNEAWYQGMDEKPFNLQAAVDLLADAGYEWDENGHLYYPEDKD